MEALQRLCVLLQSTDFAKAPRVEAPDEEVVKVERKPTLAARETAPKRHSHRAPGAGPSP